MVECLSDTRFEYFSDNPFANDTQKIKLRKLKCYIKDNIENFTEINYKSDSRYLIIKPDTEQLFGEKIDNIDIENTKLGQSVKDFLITVPFISNELKIWCGKQSTITPMPEIEEFTTAEPEMLRGDDFSTIAMGSIVPHNYVFSGSNISYDTSNEKLLTFEDLRKLTLNIARSRLDPNAKKDETIIELEKEKRRLLIGEIKEFKNVTKINPWIDDYDLQSMTLEQLENCRDLCEKLHSRHKIDEVLASGFNLCSIGYNTVFPDGIPISENKRLKFTGVGTALRDKFFDTRKTVGFSFSRILSKKNIHITDELAIIIGIGETIISNSQIVDINDKNKQYDNDDDEESDIEEL